MGQDGVVSILAVWGDSDACARRRSPILACPPQTRCWWSRRARLCAC